MVVYAPAQIISAPAQLITAPAQPPATGAVVYTALFQLFKLLGQDTLLCKSHCSSTISTRNFTLRRKNDDEKRRKIPLFLVAFESSCDVFMGAYFQKIWRGLGKRALTKSAALLCRGCAGAVWPLSYAGTVTVSVTAVQCSAVGRWCVLKFWL